MAQTWDRALTRKRNQSRHRALILGMRDKAAAKGAEFIVVNETLSPSRTPGSDGLYGCSVDQQSVEAGDALRALGVKVIDTIRSFLCSSVIPALGSRRGMGIHRLLPISNWHERVLSGSSSLHEQD